MADTLTKLRTELDTLRKDAERYRWLRNEVLDWYVGPKYETYNDRVCDGEYRDLSCGGVELDSVIDAALTKEAAK